MTEEKETNEINKNMNSKEENNLIVNDYLNSDFFKFFETPQKLHEKREKITKLINFLQENKNYFKSLKEPKNLNLLFDIILTNLIENNNNFVLIQINLIKILCEKISLIENENEQIKLDFINFIKKSLSKLFDKFYLQNSKINNNLFEVFVLFLEKNILNIKDYFPLIENINTEEDDEYKINILNLIIKIIDNDEKINKESFPENIINIFEKLAENDENESLREKAINIIEILNSRKNEEISSNDNNNILNEFEIPNTPLSQQDSKLAFSSFIKKISKAIRKENLDKINNNNNNNNNNKDKEELNEERDKENGQIDKIEKKIDNIEPDIKIEENNLDINQENNNDFFNDNEEIKNEEKKESYEKEKRIISHIKRIKSKDEVNINNDNNNNKNDINNEKEENQKLQNDDTIPQTIEQNEEKKEKKENKNKKAIKTRITRSRKLGVMIKQKNNKDKEKDKDKEDNEQKRIPIIVNKVNLNQNENNSLKEEEKNISPSNNNIINNIPQNNLNEKLVEEITEKINNKESQETVQIQENENKKEKETEIEDNIQKNIIEDFDEIPIITNKNKLIEDITSEEENGIKISKKESMNEFNKKLDSALEQENQDFLIKQKSVSNLNEKEKEKENDKEKEKEKEKEIDDPKYNELKSILGSEICDLITSQKWENKKHALEQINILIEENNILMNYNDLFNYIKLKLKNFKETNFNIIREALNIFISLLKKKSLSKDNFLLLINIYYEKISDIKLKDNFIELINTAIEESIIDPGSIISNLISKISKKKNQKILSEYSMLFNKLIEENDIKDLPINDIVKYCKLMAGNSNPQVRTSATNLICILYKYMGEDLKPLLKDIKESTLKMIEAELEKVTIIEKKEDEKNKSKKSIIKKISKNEKNINDQIEIGTSDPIDISKKINLYLKDLSEGKWQEKKEAIENIENILTEAKNKILPTGLNDIFLLIKSKLSDGNKNYVKMLISLLTKFISSLKKEFKPWCKMIALNLIPILSDKNQSIRKECEQCFETWVNFIGIDSLVIHFPQFLKNENVESRIEIMKFIKKYNYQFSRNLGENIYKELIDSLLICLQDRSNNVRNEAEDIIMLSLDFVDIEIYYKKIKDFKPAIEKDIKLILDNINEKRNINNNINNENDISNDDLDNNDDNNDNNDNYQHPNFNSFNSDNNFQNENTKSSIKIKKKYSHNINKDISPDKAFNIKEKMRNSFKMKKSGNLDKRNNNNLSNLNINKEEKIYYNNDYLSVDEEPEKNFFMNSSEIKRKRNIIKTAEKEKYKKANSKMIEKKEKFNLNSENKEGGTLSCNSTVLRRQKNINNSIEKRMKINVKNIANKNNNKIFNINNNMKIPLSKHRRLELDKKFKFSIDTISNDDINKLKEFSKIIFIDDFNTKIFENDLNKEIDFFKRIKNNLETKENLEFFFDNLDIILKIISLKINNNYNPSLLKHFFSLLEILYIIITETKYQMNEIESNIIICLLIDKISINNSQIKESAVNLINNYFEIVDITKVFLSVLNYALNKNNKTKLQILEMTLQLHLNKKINMTSKSYIKILSKYLSLNDSTIKSKCLEIFGELHDYIKEEILNIKEKNNSENNSENEEDEEENNKNEIQDDNSDKSDKIDINEEEIFNNDKYDFNNDKNDEDNFNKFYLSEERYQNLNLFKNNNDNNNDNNNSEFDIDENKDKNSENDILANKVSTKINKTNNNQYMKTDNKFEENDLKNNIKKEPVYYKNTEITSKIQKIKSMKKNININDNSEIKPKSYIDKFSLPKKKLKNNNNANKKLKVFNNKLNKSQNFKQKFKISASNKNINTRNNNNRNNNIINNYNNVDNNSNGNNINNNNDISISLYNDININSSKNNTISNSTIHSEKDLLEIMNSLFSDDESEKMGTIIIIHEILCSKYQQNKYILIPNIDSIIKIIIQITHELFENIENLNNKIIPLKFAKYLATILFKLTSNKELIFHISFKVLFDLCFEILNYLLINDLDKIGSNQEGNIIFKSLNSAMLRVLENCDTTSVILALLEIVKQNQNNKESTLLCNLAMKCLFKVTQNIKLIINKIQLDKILLQMHLLTYNFDKLSNGKETNSQNNIMIIRFIKNLIIDIVKIKKGKILEDYNKSILNNQYKDKYIYNWIINALETLDYTENEEDNFSNNDLSKNTNFRSSSTNMNKNRINNSDKKKENGGFVFDNNLNKKSVIIVKKHANNSINNRYNLNSNYNTQSGVNNNVNNITATKSSILGTSNINNNHRINVQKNLGSKNSQIYNKTDIKKKKSKLNK